MIEPHKLPAHSWRYMYEVEKYMQDYPPTSEDTNGEVYSGNWVLYHLQTEQEKQREHDQGLNNCHSRFLVDKGLGTYGGQIYQ